MSGGEGWAEGEKESLKQTLCSAWSPSQGSVPETWDHNLSQNQESDTPSTEHPGALGFIF